MRGIQKRLLVLIFFGTTAAQAQIQSFNYDSVSVRAGISLPEVPLSIQATDGDSGVKPLEYSQNSRPKFGLGVDWGDLGAYVSFLNLKAAGDENKFGKTSYFDLQFHLFFGNWGLDLFWQDFEGYYLENTKAVLPDYYEASGNLIREDIESTFVGFNINYIFHPERLSYSAAMSGTAQQKASGGSWSLLASYTDQSIHSGGTLAPEELADDYGEMGNIKSARFKTIPLGGGYGYTWSFWSTWYFHITLSLAIGPQYQDYTTQDYGHKKRWKFAAKGMTRAAFGANGKSYFGGIALNADSTSFEVQDRTLNFDSTWSFLYFGYRFEI